MPSSLDGEPRRRRRHDHDRDRDSTSSRDKPHRSSHKSASSSKLPLHKRKSASRERERERDSPRASASPIKTKTSSIVVPEMERRGSGEVRPTTSYPSFSKAHSREAVGSREDIAAKTLFTPDATDISNDGAKRRNSSPAKPGAPTRAPPSPPLTAEDPDIRRSGSSRSMREAAEDVKVKMESGRRSTDSPRKHGMKAAKSGTSLRKEARFDASDVSSMPGAFPEDEGKSTPNSSYRRTASTASQPPSTLTEDTTDSDATSIAPERKPHKRPNTTPPDEKSPSKGTESRPKTPAQDEVPIPPQARATPIIDVGIANKTNLQPMNTPMTAKQVPPPPPPPPMTEPKEAPRVDYLLKNGGLPTPVPKRLVQPPTPIQAYSVYQSPALTQAAPLEEYAKIFGTVHKRLDDYIQVLKSNGSLAVATGYKSVARRLLDKLSQVFARDISSQRCDCVVCKTTPQPRLSDEEENGVSWGEILEFVAGRRELPQWPPFTIQPDDSGLGISGTTQAPMQKLDIDVPEEYRDHYIRQNQKTKRAVQSWLAQQPEVPSAPPEEADEDTLMFAMMTKLTVQQRNLFIALMHGQNFVSEVRAPTPAERPSTSSNALRRAKKALQRLYRLERAPRDCEAAMYLLNNPHLHGMLATLAEVNEAEWEILTSGRFDGFLWSGAEAAFPPSASHFASMASRGPSRGPNATPFSRNTTPFSGMSAIPSRHGTPFSPDLGQPPSMFPSRGPTPGLNGLGVTAPGPVQLDEDTEIAVAAELERNLFLDMERLEDAFEILHGRAELVRQMLRERSAGLSAQAQLRRGSGAADPVGVRLDTPASGVTDFEEEDDDGLADLASLAPDDSASQISVNRRHRHRRERKTPNPEPVPEEDESVFEEHERTRRERNGRRSKY
ncbi:hypothetical protein M409DRAFT_21006 [Zasmidium cellare ATCC 36951]|uniref:5-Methylcytosine G/T mismatch-specific DNA glycosylase n=1 Tax=Zasmidium cellare ATCC 36951 TaxID=1080233 RepID=A0A6A6CPG6_ZASCE|nr:uncharacterized protein M409DRAFT_21006 [Zasmidium cellare ATCC 36951]KAF2168995.1 hypothetical protein M409DRAFT_21006 [Zasmidium cellare ATCC 36951]